MDSQDLDIAYPPEDSYNSSWDKVWEWLSNQNHLIIPSDPDSKVIQWDNDTIFLESKGQVQEYLLVNNVINFTDNSLETDVFKSMQRNEFAYWKSRTTKQLYSKYDYHIKMNLVHTLKKDGYEITDPFRAFSTVIDVGCGVDGFGECFQASIFRIGVDTLAHKYTELKPVIPSFPKIACYAEKLPFKDEAFELAISTNALDHGMSWKHSLIELVRCTRVKGYVFITMDCKSENELDETHQIPVDSEEVYQTIIELPIRLDYLQFGPKRNCDKRIIFFGRKVMEDNKI